MKCENKLGEPLPPQQGAIHCVYREEPTRQPLLGPVFPTCVMGVRG